jgi:hypothetical protein
MNEEDSMFYAAKAAGHQRLKLFPDGWYVSNDLHGEDWHLWQPLTDDGDALRVALKLGMVLDMRYTDPAAMKFNRVNFWLPGKEAAPYSHLEFDLDTDPAAAAPPDRPTLGKNP